MKTLLLLCLLLPAALRAQQPVTPEEAYLNLAAMTPQDYIDLQLPPLQTLLDNARTSPQMAFYESNVDMERRELKTVRREWMTYLKFNGSYNYGSSDIYNQTYIDNGVPVVNNSGRRQNYWNVGGSVSIPLSGILNRRNKIKQQKMRLEQVEHDLDRSFDELRLKIIETYSTVIEQLSSLQSVTEAMTMAQTNYAGAETDFLNGKLDMQSLARQKSIEASAIRAYEEVRRALNSALLQLEVFTNTPIISRRRTQPAETEAPAADPATTAGSEAPAPTQTADRTQAAADPAQITSASTR